MTPRAQAYLDRTGKSWDDLPPNIQAFLNRRSNDELNSAELIARLKAEIAYIEEQIDDRHITNELDDLIVDEDEINIACWRIIDLLSALRAKIGDEKEDYSLPPAGPRPRPNTGDNDASSAA